MWSAHPAETVGTVVATVETAETVVAIVDRVRKDPRTKVKTRVGKNLLTFLSVQSLLHTNFNSTNEAA